MKDEIPLLRLKGVTKQFSGTVVLEDVSFDLKKGDTTATAKLSDSVIGKRAVYFEFLSANSGVIAEFDKFTFD